jgi:magnesium transporter
MNPRLTQEQLHDPISQYTRRDVVRLHAEQTVEEALDTIRAQGGEGEALYLYVVDDEDRLLGVVPTRRLLLATPGERIAALSVADVIAIPSWATVLVAAEYFVTHELLAFPVVDDGGRLVGVVDVGLFTEEVIGFAKRSFDDIFQIIGVHATAGAGSWSAFKDRFPWLLCNIGGGVLAAFLAGWYESLLEAVVLLALFIPVVLALAESVSIQSVTLTLQGLHGGPLNWSFFGRAVRREFVTAVLLGAGCAVLVGGVAWLWRGEAGVALAIGAAIWLSMITACLLGLILPTALHALRRDPRIAAGPIVLAAADLLTLLFYFNLAGWLTQG